MADCSRQHALGDYLLPVLCGNTARAHRLSARILRHLGTVSLICGKPRLRDLFDLSSHTLQLPKHASPRLVAEALMTLADTYPDRLPVLIPCSDEARALLKDYGTLLETRYLLRDEETLFSLPPLSEP